MFSQAKPQMTAGEDCWEMHHLARGWSRWKPVKHREASQRTCQFHLISRISRSKRRTSEGPSHLVFGSWFCSASHLLPWHNHRKTKASTCVRLECLDSSRLMLANLLLQLGIGNVLWFKGAVQKNGQVKAEKKVDIVDILMHIVHLPLYLI